jgi:hypothetical protein
MASVLLFPSTTALAGVAATPTEHSLRNDSLHFGRVGAFGSGVIN